jgi:N-acetylmuramoyl-L-alanine amidase
VVLDARSPLLVHNAFLLEPAAGQSWRLVLDLVPSSRDAFLRAVQTGLSHRQAAAAPRTAPPTPPTESRAPPGPAPPRIQDRRKVVVLDPGHGGVDPGTTGPSGIVEKNLTLEYAQEIKRTLESSGRYRVHLTRNTDVFVRLRERIQLARSVGAEIFLSLHADSLPDAKFRGMTVYTLSDKASDEEAEALAQRENKADVIAGIDLTDEPPEVTTILIDLAQRETMNLSVRLANSLVGEFAREGKMLRQGHRFAGFAVLKAPDVPSILIELGYLSNRQDEAQLAQPAYRKRLSTSILRAIDAYVHARDALKRP